MTLIELFGQLSVRGMSVRRCGNRIQCVGNVDLLTDELKEALIKHRQEFLRVLPDSDVKPGDAQGEQIADEDVDWFEYLDEADRQELSSIKRLFPEPCPHCGGRTRHWSCCPISIGLETPTVGFGKYRHVEIRHSQHSLGVRRPGAPGALHGQDARGGTPRCGEGGSHAVGIAGSPQGAAWCVHLHHQASQHGEIL